ncbi:hypothetical protein [Kutzneria sp. NPDC051319]|uniref:hypothetical protein n=1 Tax=Kutzneria sp. NPDC051319 TaxID=3155047 RepID=UPI003424F123
MLWRAAPVPRSGPLAESIDIRSDLMVADNYVTTVIQFVEHGVFSPAVPDVLGFLEKIMQRIDKLIAEGDLETREIARYQHAYAAVMHLIYSQFLELGSRQA